MRVNHPVLALIAVWITVEQRLSSKNRSSVVQAYVTWTAIHDTINLHAYWTNWSSAAEYHFIWTAIDALRMQVSRILNSN